MDAQVQQPVAELHSEMTQGIAEEMGWRKHECTERDKPSVCVHVEGGRINK